MGACAMALLAPVLALDLKALKPEGYLSDFSHVVGAADKQRIEQYCGEVERATGAQMALVTIDTLDGAPIEDFANSLYRQWGVGQKGKNEGVLLLLVVKDRKSRVEVGYGLEPALPDGFAGGTLRAMRPALRAGQYGQALLDGAQEMGAKIAAAKGVSLDTGQTEAPERGTRRSRGSGFPVLVILAILAILLLLGRGGVAAGSGDSSAGCCSGICWGAEEEAAVGAEEASAAAIRAAEGLAALAAEIRAAAERPATGDERWNNG